MVFMFVSDENAGDMRFFEPVSLDGQRAVPAIGLGVAPGLLPGNRDRLGQQAGSQAQVV